MHSQATASGVVAGTVGDGNKSSESFESVANKTEKVNF